MAKIELIPPQGYAELDSASVEQFGGLLTKTLGTPEQFNNFINSTLSENGESYTSIDSAAQYIASVFAESGDITVDSAFVLAQNAIWDNLLNTETEKDEGTTQTDLKDAGSVGALIGMENARKKLELDEIDKSDEFARIKKHYGLDNTATKDEAYGMLLKDLEASELSTIFKQGGLGKNAPVPLSASKWEEIGGSGQVYGGMMGPQVGVGRTIYTDVKFTEELFEDYIYRAKKNELIELAKTSKQPIDWKTLELTSKRYASNRSKKGYELYKKYQVEVLKDVGAEDGINNAMGRLESKAELERQTSGIFTDDI